MLHSPLARAVNHTPSSLVYDELILSFNSHLLFKFTTAIRTQEDKLRIALKKAVTLTNGMNEIRVYFLLHFEFTCDKLKKKSCRS